MELLKFDEKVHFVYWHENPLNLNLGLDSKLVKAGRVIGNFINQKGTLMTEIRFLKNGEPYTCTTPRVCVKKIEKKA